MHHVKQNLITFLVICLTLLSLVNACKKKGTMSREPSEDMQCCQTNTDESNASACCRHGKGTLRPEWTPMGPRKYNPKDPYAQQTKIRFYKTPKELTRDHLCRLNKCGMNTEKSPNNEQNTCQKSKD